MSKQPVTPEAPHALRRRSVSVVLAVMAVAAVFHFGTGAAEAAPRSANATTAVLQNTPAATIPEIGQAGPDAEDNRISIDLDLEALVDDSDPTATGEDAKPSKSILILVSLTLLSLAPSLLICMTSFTRIVVVLSIARNAIGLQSIPPNQVVTGLALFLSLFVMAPTIKDINDNALQPYLSGEIQQAEALREAEDPIKDFMLSNTRSDELNLMISASGEERPEELTDLSLMTVIPAFILSELKSAFIIGVMVLLPFLVIDLVVSAGLMSLGMMMLPPTFVSLPFKLLLFVMVDGWALIAQSLIANFK
ncbi:MAG: flagellar type III secretion system pore protein FliP [Actinobacteria bacterium]|nr:flagellar type III secretion system pore protein FliP [Actinomycetota bacterium]